MNMSRTPLMTPASQNGKRSRWTCNTRSLSTKHLSAIRKEEKKLRDLLSRFIKLIKHAAQQNQPLRGHREDVKDESVASKGSFLELVRLIATYDPVLSEHSTRVELGSKHSLSYMSPQIQIEIITLLGGQVRRKILEEVKAAKYYCVIIR